MRVTLGQTANFTYVYEDSIADAKRRAQALTVTCESDLSKAEPLFGVSGGFGPTNRITVVVDNPPPGAAAVNNGYHTDGSTQILAEPLNGASDEGLADDAVRALFVAELAEVLMSYLNYQTGTAMWDSGKSAGEGLSGVCAALFHKDAFYREGFGPRINQWLQSSTRTDWITNLDPSDKNADSYGCSDLFLYYLHSHLGYSWNKIITSGGSTLEATYQACTGKPGGYEAFTQLLSTYFPIGDTPFLPFDNPFPLGSPLNVTIGFEQFTEYSSDGDSGEATIPPGPDCSPKTYKWKFTDLSEYLFCNALVSGFGQPLFEWYLHGQKLTGAGGVDTFQLTVMEDNPNNPDQPIFTVKPVTLSWQYTGDDTYQSLGNSLMLQNVASDGHAFVDLSVSVSEKYIPAHTASNIAIGQIDTQELTYEDQYYKDRDLCFARWRTKVDREFGRPQTLPHWVEVLLNSPNPPIELARAGRVLEQLAGEIDGIATRNRRLAAELARVFSTRLNVPAGWLLKERGED